MPKRRARGSSEYSNQSALAGNLESIRARCGFLAAGYWKQEALGAAHKRIPALIEAKRKIGGAGDADANGLADGADREVCSPEPERAGCAKIEAVVAAVDSKGRAQAAGTAGEIEKASGLAMAPHVSDPLEGFKSSDENGGSDSGGLADDVQHEMNAVIEKNIYVTRGQIHRADAWRWPAEMVTGGIAGGIGFDFDNATAQTAGREIVDDDFTDEEAREFEGFCWKFRAVQPAEREFGGEIAHGENDLFFRRVSGSRQDALELVRGDEILDFRMPVNIAGDEGTERNNAKLIGAGKIERGAGEFGGEAFSFEGRGNFGVIEDDLAGKAAIGD
jgi:hypothetical protein